MSFSLANSGLQLKLAKITIMTSQQHTLCFSLVDDAASLAEARLSLAGLSENCRQSRTCLSLHLSLSPWDITGWNAIVLFIQYQRCCCINLNKEGHWTELSVWLPFRTAVNAILLIRLLKASLPVRSLCEGNTMQAVQTPQKGIALESHTSAVWPLAMLRRSVESLWTPSQLQSREQNRF